MLRINLLPPYIFDKQKKRNVAILWGVAAAAAIALFVVWAGGVNGTLDDYKKQLAEATDFKTKYDDTETKITKVNADVAVIRSKQTFIASSKTNNDAWPAVYDSMRDVTSPTILLQSLAIEPTNHKALDFAGFAKDELTIARWWMSLRNAKDRFDSVSFNLPPHPFLGGGTGANAAGGPGGFAGMQRGMGGPPMGMNGSSMGGPGGPMMASTGAPGGLAGKFARGGGMGGGGFGGGGFGGGGGNNANVGMTEIEGRAGLNFTGVAMVKDNYAPPVAPTWPAGGGASAGNGFGGFGGMGGMPGMGGGRMGMGAPAGAAGGGGKRGANGGGQD